MTVAILDLIQSIASWQLKTFQLMCCASAYCSRISTCERSLQHTLLQPSFSPHQLLHHVADLSKLCISVCISPDSWLFALWLTSVVHHHRCVSAPNKSPQRKSSGRIQLTCRNVVLVWDKKRNLFNLITAIQAGAGLNNIQPLNFHRAFLGLHFVRFLVYFHGSKGRCPDAAVLIYIFPPASLSHVMPFTVWFQLCMQVLSMNVWCLTVQKALSEGLYGARCAVWEHAAADRAGY